MTKVKESKRRRISKLAFTTLNSFAAGIVLLFVYFLHNKGMVDAEAVTKVSVGSMGIISGIVIVSVLSYLKDREAKKQIATQKKLESELALLKAYHATKLDHDSQLDQIIASLQAQKYQK